MYLRVSGIALAVVLCVPVVAGEFSTYVGDVSDYHVSRIITDGAGNTYIAGSRTLASQSSEAIVIELDAAGKIARFITISGRGTDAATALALDSGGNLYIAGTTTSPDLPMHNPFQSTPGPGFIAKYSADASQLLYSTYFPGAISGLAVDSARNIYVTGTATAPDFPVTAGLLAGSYSGAPPDAYTGNTGAFLTKLSAAGDRILYSALMAGVSQPCTEFLECHFAYTNGVDVALDPSGSAYLLGYTSTTDLPATQGALLAQGIGAFVAKLNAAGTAYSYLTYLAAGRDPVYPIPVPANVASAIAVDAAGDAYIAGQTFDSQFPATPGAYQTAFDGLPLDLDHPEQPTDAFVAKLNPSGSGLVWATFIGGKSSDWATSISLDPSGNVWIAGGTNSSDFPNAQGWSQGNDFVVGLNPTASALIYGSRFPTGAASQSIAVDAAGLVHLAGPTGLLSAIAPNHQASPQIFGIANAAAGPAAGRIAPGEIISVYGPHIGTTPDLQISIGGNSAPVLYVSDSQINAIVPFNVSSQEFAAVRIASGSAAIPDFTAVVIPSEPEVFQDASGNAAAVNQDGTINSSQNPAIAGSTVSIWLNGAGLVAGFNGFTAGEVATEAIDFHCCSVTIESTPAEVLYAGTAPGLVTGIVQINFRIPLSFQASPNPSLIVQVGTATSLPVHIW